jgi:hypothetical protein
VNAEMQRIETAWNELGELVDRVKDASGLTQAGADGWQVKDHLTHIAAWELSLLGLIEGRDRLKAMGVPEPVEENTDAVNEAVWKLHRGKSAAQALKYFRDTHRALVAALGKLSDADLKQPYSHYQPSNPTQKNPVGNWVAGNTYEHYAEHIAWINQLIKESSAAR